MEKEYNQLLLTKISELTKHFNNVLTECQINISESNFDSFKHWLELSRIHSSLLDLQLNIAVENYSKKE